MRYLSLLLPVAVLSLGHAKVAQPSPPISVGDPGRDMATLMEELMLWVSEASGMGLCAAPTLRRASSREIVRRWYGRDMPEEQVIKLLALYEHPARTVYVSTAFDADLLLDRSILLHELVHHLQECNDIEFECCAASEPQAYELQARWLDEQGVDDPWGLMGVDRFTAYALSACPE